MIGLDTNFMIDLMVASMPGHTEAHQKINQIEDQLCTTPTNIGECLRLLTHPKVFPKPLALPQAVDLLKNLVNKLSISLLEESVDWWFDLKELCHEVTGIRGNEVFDARIALCFKANQVKKILTRDTDFRKYKFLKIV